MADITGFSNEFLPKKVAGNADLQKEGGVYQFDIAGTGTWSLDLSAGTVTEGPHANPGCKITTDTATWSAILDKPSYAMQAFMTGKLKASNLGMATKLQKILG